MSDLRIKKLIRLEDIMDDARRYLQRTMSTCERKAFEQMLEKHPDLQKELALFHAILENLTPPGTTSSGSGKIPSESSSPD